MLKGNYWYRTYGVERNLISLLNTLTLRTNEDRLSNKFLTIQTSISFDEIHGLLRGKKDAFSPNNLSQVAERRPGRGRLARKFTNERENRYDESLTGPQATFSPHCSKHRVPRTRTVLRSRKIGDGARCMTSCDVADNDDEDIGPNEDCTVIHND